jgi:16S rRNA (guanine527-N7)-methyltransferase
MTKIRDNTIIIETLRPYGVVASPELCDSIRTYIELLLRWNDKIALTTIVDPLEILRFHFGESMFAANAVPIRHGRLADVGTGAGFPAIPLCMVSPDIECVLIESNQKKATFLAEALRILELDRIQIFRDRMEDYPNSPSNFDFTVCRALGMFAEFLNWSSTHLSASGRVVFLSSDQDAAKIATDTPWKWRVPIRLPQSDYRSLLIGSPIVAKP